MRESVTTKCKKKKCRDYCDYWLLLLLHAVLVLHRNDSHHFLLDVWDLRVDLPDHIIHSSLVEGNENFQWWKIISNWSSRQKKLQRVFLLRAERCKKPQNRQQTTDLIVFVNKRESEESNPCQNDEGHHIEPSSCWMQLMFRIKKIQTRIQYTSVPTSRGWTWWYQRCSPARRVSWAPWLRDWWRPPGSRWCRPPSQAGQWGRCWWRPAGGHSRPPPEHRQTSGLRTVANMVDISQPICPSVPSRFPTVTV